MNIALTTKTPDFQAEIDPRFGRAAYLLVVDLSSMNWHAYYNPGSLATGGAGVQTAQFVAEKQVDAVVSGDYGPQAYQALQAAGITMYLYGDARTANQTVERFKVGQLQQVGAPTR